MSVGRTFQVGSLHLGPSGNVRTFSQTALEYPAQTGQLGQIFESNGAFFRLVQAYMVNTALIDGGVVYWKDKANWIVSAAHGDSEGGAACIAGGTSVALATDAANGTHYVFIQCGGDQKAVVVAASAVAGDLLSGSASSDNVLTRTAAGSSCPDVEAAICLSSRGTTTSDNGASVSNSSKVRWMQGMLGF